MNRKYCGSCSGAYRLFHVDNKMIKGPGLPAFARFFPDDEQLGMQMVQTAAFVRVPARTRFAQ
jgi:hypothetical protein